MSLWFDKLKASLEITPDRLRLDTKRKYTDPMDDMAKTPTDYLGWVESWQLNMVTCCQQELAEALGLSEWWGDLAAKIKHVLPTWPDDFLTANRHRLRDSSLAI